MKKFQMGMFALAGALTIGGGAVYASEQIQTKSVRVDGIQIEVEDEEVLKALENEEIEMNLSTLKVTYKGQEIPLTLKGYGILKYLIENKGKPISSEEIFEHVWDEYADPFSNVIRVHIYSLRKKLMKQTGKKDMITTLKGVGYMFVGSENE